MQLMLRSCSYCKVIILLKCNIEVAKEKIKKYIIDPYYAEHPGEDIEKRQALGIEVEEKRETKSEEEDDGKSESVIED